MKHARLQHCSCTAHISPLCKIKQHFHLITHELCGFRITFIYARRVKKNGISVRGVGSRSRSFRSISAGVFGLCVMGWGNLEQWRQSCFISSQTWFPHMFLINISAWHTSIKSCMDGNMLNEMSGYGWHVAHLPALLLPLPLQCCSA